MNRRFTTAETALLRDAMNTAARYWRNNGAKGAARADRAATLAALLDKAEEIRIDTGADDLPDEEEPDPCPVRHPDA